VEDSGAFGAFMLRIAPMRVQKWNAVTEILVIAHRAWFSLSCLPLKQLVRPGTISVNTNLLWQRVGERSHFPWCSFRLLRLAQKCGKTRGW